MTKFLKPMALRAKVTLDKLAIRLFGRRFFTEVLTDASMAIAIDAAKQARGGSLLPDAKLIKKAADAYNSVRRVG